MFLIKITNIYFKLCYYLGCDLILVCMGQVWGRIKHKELGYE
ncbi:hypothetical protein HPCPY6081_1105 [Helicobacter pylori CPY6081]|nr:hypothetical protein HPCPY6081_1105 [Helicobacter pylori CPY6081]